MNFKNPKLLLVFVIMAFARNSILAQTTSTDNTLGATGVTAIQSITKSNYQLSVGGAIKIFNSGLSSASLYLLNTSTFRKNYYINSDDAGSLRIIDDAVGTDLGDNQIILLKKMEELTLYMIEKDKEVKEL